MLDIVCWKWRPLVADYRSTFGARQVNVLRAMIARHYQKPHRFNCITDDPAGIDPRVRVIPLWPDHAGMISMHGKRNPSCYRRLRVFARDAADLIGPRFVSLDLDCVVTADLAPIFDRPEDFVMWEGTAGINHFNGSMFMMTAGARPHVWERFDPLRSPLEAARNRFLGSDQAHICNMLPRGTEARWTKADGVYSWRNHLRRHKGKLPDGSDPSRPAGRLVFFHGNAGDPWSPRVQEAAPWSKDHWRE